jgi:GMP synthase (glutamine-hydrolysing)
MRKLFILTVGNTFPHIAARKGDFTDWFVTGLQVDPAHLSILDPREGTDLPDPSEVAGVLITGSHSMVTEHQPWSERVARWLPDIVERGIPLLGVCYGHQLLAYALGGAVGDNSVGREYGTADITLTAQGQTDPLLRDAGALFRAQVGHVQTVLTLPAGARLLASSPMDRHQAFAVGDCAWGLQFHPEMDVDIIREYVRHNRAVLSAQGQDPNALLAASEETPASAAILQRFGKIVFAASSVISERQVSQ